MFKDYGLFSDNKDYVQRIRGLLVVVFGFFDNSCLRTEPPVSLKRPQEVHVDPRSKSNVIGKGMKSSLYVCGSPSKYTITMYTTHNLVHLLLAYTVGVQSETYKLEWL